MLISMLPIYSFFTDTKRYHSGSSSSKPKVPKPSGRHYLDYDEENDRHVQRGAATQERVSDARRARQDAALQREEKAKKARLDNITTVKDLNKDDFRTMRGQSFYDMPQNSTDAHFWRKEQELIMKEI